MVSTPTCQIRKDVSFREVLEENFKFNSIIQVGAGSSIPLLKNHLWLVVRGMVKLGCITIHGDEILLGLAGPNEVFGDSLTGAEAYEVQALTDCDLLCLAMGEMKVCPELSQALIGGITQRHRQSQAMLALMGLKRVEDRVKGFLELLAIEYGVFCQDGLLITAKLTHQEIANALGTTRVTVTRVIGQLKECGWLSLDKNRFLVLAPNPKK